MKDLSKTSQEVLDEIATLKQRIRELEISEAEQLARRESEMDMLMNKLKSEKQVFEQALDNLKQQFTTWFDSIFERRH